jgi:hypothetical protein
MTIIDQGMKTGMEAVHQQLPPVFSPIVAPEFHTDRTKVAGGPSNKPFYDFAKDVYGALLETSVDAQAEGFSPVQKVVKTVEEIRLLDRVRALAYDNSHRLPSAAGLYLIVQGEMHDRNSTDYVPPMLSRSELDPKEALTPLLHNTNKPSEGGRLVAKSAYAEEYRKLHSHEPK